MRRGSGRQSTSATRRLMTRRHRCCKLRALLLRTKGCTSFRCTAVAVGRGRDESPGASCLGAGRAGVGTGSGLSLRVSAAQEAT